MRSRLASLVAAALIASLVTPVRAGGPTGDEREGGFLASANGAPGTNGSTGAGAGGVQPEPASGFTDTTVITNLTAPTAVRFAADGRVLVAEKRGKVLLYQSLGAAPTVALDIRPKVHDYWDRGLLGMALDPAFVSNGRIYVLYTYDHILGSATPAPRWGDGCPSPPGGTLDGCVVSARLSRFTLTNGVAGTEHVLVEDWCQQFPSHSIGDLAFGPDGYLYASGGEGATPWAADWGQHGGSAGSPVPANPCGDPPGGIGVANTRPSGRGGGLRSQSLGRPSGEPVVLNGTIIRVDPSTGAAAPGNPLAGHASANARKVVAYGLRNPFRITFRPGANELWIGDVGWNRREEIERLVTPSAGPVENFGWPCYEGVQQRSGYTGLTQCIDLYAAGAAAVTAPFFTYQHGVEVIPGDACPTANGSVISGVSFYTGGGYPARFTDALVFTDYNRKCIWAMKATDGLPDPARLELLVRNAANPVDLRAGPGGDLFYVDHQNGSIRRIRYSAGNAPPAAAMTATPSTGLAPLEVEFDGRLSADSDPGDHLTYAWDFTDDGSVDATTPTASFEYTTPAVFTVRLTVTDEHGASSSATRQIVADGSAPIPRIDTPEETLEWAVGDEIPFSGSATDGEGSPLPASALTWTLTLLHCTDVSSCHPHVVETRDGVAGGSFDAPDHSWPSSLVVGLTATNAGVESQATVRVEPVSVTLAFTTSPNGLALAINESTLSGTAGDPVIMSTVIVGSSIGLAAPSPQVLDGIRRTFSRWSDGSTAASRNVLAPADPWSTPLGAIFRSTSADLSLEQTGVLSASGRSIGWKVVVRNRDGGIRARDLRVRVDLPAKVGPPTFDAPGWTCRYRAARHRAVCDLDSLAVGTKGVIRFRTPLLRDGEKARAVAWVVSETRDVSLANNTDTTRVPLP